MKNTFQTGYSCGGDSSNVVDALSFPVDTQAQVAKGVCPWSDIAGSVTTDFSQNISLMMGHGNPGAENTATCTWSWSTDTAAAVTGTSLPSARSRSSGVQSATSSYTCGGYSGGDIATSVAMFWATITTSAVVKGSLTSARYGVNGGHGGAS
jgi:hypothetical protein